MFCFCTGKKEEAAKDSGFVDVAKVEDEAASTVASVPGLDGSEVEKTEPTFTERSLPTETVVETKSLQTKASDATVQKVPASAVQTLQSTPDALDSKPEQTQVAPQPQASETALASEDVQLESSPVAATATGAPPTVPSEPHDAVSTEEVMTLLRRIGKENAWRERREAKKASSKNKKKSRRNNKPKNTKASAAKKPAAKTTAGQKAPLQTRN